MPPIDLFSTLGLDNVTATHFGTLLLRLVVAAVLGSLLGFRVWRRLIGRAAPPPRDTAQAQTLISVAGALMVAVIGDSTARAFGLVGLGAFIRFRSGIKDPRDAAVMFVMIGIGMACGHGSMPLALVATVFTGAVLAIFDVVGRGRVRLSRVGIEVENPRESFPAIVKTFPEARVLEAPNTNPHSGTVVLEMQIQDDVDASTILALLERRQVQGVRQVKLEEGRAV